VIFSGIALDEFDTRRTVVATVPRSNAFVFLALLIESAGACLCRERFLGFEVSIEAAVGQPRLGHKGRDAYAVDAMLPE
jgi:hypothetical protein